MVNTSPPIVDTNLDAAIAALPAVDPSLDAQRTALQAQILPLMQQLQSLNAQMNTPEIQAVKILNALKMGVTLPPQLLNRLGIDV